MTGANNVPSTSKSKRDSAEPSLANGAFKPAPLKEEDEVTLWVCDKCFKYMKEGSSCELHVVRGFERHLGLEANLLFRNHRRLVR